jgi:hypothetical protein
VRPRIEAIPHGCYAVGCMAIVQPEKFMCATHAALIPEANKAELERTFTAWRSALGTRAKYAAARIRAIIAVAAVEGLEAAHNLHGILQKLDSGEWKYDA